MDAEALAQRFTQMHLDYARLMARMSDLMSNNGEIGVLLWLDAQNQDAFAVDISAHFGLTAGRVANIVKKLEQRGYITRGHGDADQRRRRITLTDEGHTRAAELTRDMHRRHLAVVTALGETDTEELMRIMKKLIASDEVVNLL